MCARADLPRGDAVDAGLNAAPQVRLPQVVQPHAPAQRTHAGWRGGAEQAACHAQRRTHTCVFTCSTRRARVAQPLACARPSAAGARRDTARTPGSVCTPRARPHLYALMRHSPSRVGEKACEASSLTAYPRSSCFWMCSAAERGGVTQGRGGGGRGRRAKGKDKGSATSGGRTAGVGDPRMYDRACGRGRGASVHARCCIAGARAHAEWCRGEA